MVSIRFHIKSAFCQVRAVSYLRLVTPNAHFVTPNIPSISFWVFRRYMAMGLLMFRVTAMACAAEHNATQLLNLRSAVTVEARPMFEVQRFGLTQ